MLFFIGAFLIWPIESCRNNKGNFISEEDHNNLINEKTNRIRYLEKLYDTGKDIINSKDELLREKDVTISKTTRESNFYFDKWNKTEEYRQEQLIEFNKVQAEMTKNVEEKEEQLTASTLAIRAITELQTENKRFFSEVLDLMVSMNNKQGELIISAHKTQRETMKILEKVVEVSNKMHQEIKNYGENQKTLLNIVANMTEDEQELYSMIR